MLIFNSCRLSNLLQELTLAKEFGRKQIILDEARLSENPVQRLSRLIRYSFWDGLTRRIDASSIEKAGTDPKDVGHLHCSIFPFLNLGIQ